MLVEELLLLLGMEEKNGLRTIVLASGTGFVALVGILIGLVECLGVVLPWEPVSDFLAVDGSLNRESLKPPKFIACWRVYVVLPGALLGWFWTPNWKKVPLEEGCEVFPETLLDPGEYCEVIEGNKGFLHGVSGGAIWLSPKGFFLLRFEIRPVLINAVWRGLTNLRFSGVENSGVKLCMAVPESKERLELLAGLLVPRDGLAGKDEAEDWVLEKLKEFTGDTDCCGFDFSPREEEGYENAKVWEGLVDKLLLKLEKTGGFGGKRLDDDGRGLVFSWGFIFVSFALVRVARVESWIVERCRSIERDLTETPVEKSMAECKREKVSNQ